MCVISSIVASQFRYCKAQNLLWCENRGMLMYLKMRHKSSSGSPWNYSLEHTAGKQPSGEATSKSRLILWFSFSMVSTNKGRGYKCNVFSHLISHCYDIQKKDLGRWHKKMLLGRWTYLFLLDPFMIILKLLCYNQWTLLTHDVILATL